MALAETQVVVRFAGGVETKEDRKGVLPTKLLALENAVFTKAVSTTKRFGYDDLGTSIMGGSTTLPPALALGSRGDELLAFSADQVHSWVDGTDRWVTAGELRSVISSAVPVAKTGTNQTLADCAVSEGVALYAWEDSAGGTWYSLLDDATGRSLVAPTQVHAEATRPRCVALGSFLYLVYAMAAAGELRALRFSHDEPTAAPEMRILRTDLSTSLPCFDMALHAGNAALAWVRDSGDVGVAYLHASGIIGGTGLGLPLPIAVTGPVASAVAVCTDGDDRLIVAWTSGLSVYYRTFDASSLVAIHTARSVGTESTAPVQLTCSFDGRTSDAGVATAWVAYQVSAFSAQNHRVHAARIDVSPSALTVHDSWTQRGCGLVSRAFQHDGDAYVHLGRDSRLYRTYYTARMRGRMVVARHLSGIGAGHLEKAHLPTVNFDGAEWFWPAIYVMDVESLAHDIFTEKGIRKVSLDFASDDAFRTVELGKTAYIAGGLLHAYDGQRVVEAEFHYAIDDIPTPTQGAPTGTGIADGTYNYCFALENTLANGEIQRGPISAPVTVEVTGGPRRVTFSVPTYRLTAMPNARIAVYRTLDGDASLYNRISDLDPATAGDVNGYLANSTTADSVSFADEMTDATLESQVGLYSTGGIPGNDPLCGAKLVAAGKGRVFVVDASDPLTVYYSQERADGYALETTPLLRFEVDPFGGDITGIAVMDESLVVFKETAIFHVTGPGPLADPNVGGGWTPPEMIASDVGCVSPDAVVLTPDGLMFQSQKGIHLLGRDRTVVYIGAPVEAYNDQDVTAATILDDRTQVRFLTSSGKALLYDYERRQWSTFTNHVGADAIVVGGVYHYLRNDGRIWRETTSYADGHAQIRKVVETAWINIAGHMQALSWVWWMTVLGEFKSAHRLRLYVAYDYQEGWTGGPIDIDPLEGRVEGSYGEGVYGAGPYGGSADARYQFQIHIGQECQSIRFRFEDLEADGDYGASFELSELHLSGGVERSHFTVGEARSH